MTNSEKFEEIFGFKPSRIGICPDDYKCPVGILKGCNGCKYQGWLDQEYVPTAEKLAWTQRVLDCINNDDLDGAVKEICKGSRSEENNYGKR